MSIQHIFAAVLLFCVSSAQALNLQVRTIPEDGVVHPGQKVSLVMTLTNDSGATLPGLTRIRAGVKSLSPPNSTSTCQLGLMYLSPPSSEASFYFDWEVLNLSPNESRSCTANLTVGSGPIGTIPIHFKNAGITLASVEFRGQSLVSVPSTTNYALLLLATVISFTAWKFGRQ